MSQKAEIQSLKQQVATLEAENVERAKIIECKDEEIRELNETVESLNGDIQRLKDKPSEIVGGVKAKGYNPWDGDTDTEDVPEQYRKLFVGGLNYITEKEALDEHFSKYGEIVQSGIAKTRTNQSRGFGFIVYKTADMVDAAQKARPHKLEGRKLNTTRALVKEDSHKPENLINTKRLFVGDLPRDAKESDIRSAFEKFGEIESVGLQITKSGENKGFCIMNFTDYDIVDKLNLIKHMPIKRSMCEMKKARPRDQDRQYDARKRDSWGPPSSRDQKPDMGYSSKSYSKQNDDYGSFGYKGQSQDYGRNQSNSYSNQDRGYSNQDKGYGSQSQGYVNQDKGYGSQAHGYGNQGGSSYSQKGSSRGEVPMDTTSHDPKPVTSKEAQALAAYYSILAAESGDSSNQGLLGGGPIRGSSYSQSNRSSTPYNQSGYSGNGTGGYDRR